MVITKLQTLAAKFVSKSAVRPELGYVHTTGRTAQATDSFRLMEITCDIYEDEEAVLYHADDVKRIKYPKGEDGAIVNGIVATTGAGDTALLQKDADTYPLTKQIWDRTEDKEYIEMKVNGVYLAELAQALAKFDGFEKVVLKVPKDGGFEPIILTAKGQGHTARALLMPMTS